MKSEEKEYGDVIVLDSVRETYENLPLKTLEVFKHVSRHHGDAFHFIAKCDDDVFVDHDALKVSAAAVDKKKQPAEYIGFFHNDTIPMKKESCKWFDKDFEMGETHLMGNVLYACAYREMDFKTGHIKPMVQRRQHRRHLAPAVESTNCTLGSDMAISHLLVGQTKVPVAIHVEWATGQVQKGWSAMPQ